MAEQTQAQTLGLFDPQRWGLPDEAVAQLADRLQRVWKRFCACFKTQTRDPSDYARIYLRGLLTLDTKRNFANLARRVIDPQEDGQNVQHFISDSPWSADAVFAKIQSEIQQRPELSGGMLTLDESGDQCAGEHKAGAGRQWLGRYGKVDLGQVGVALGYYQADVWLMVDAELYLTEDWFDDAHADLRRRWHIPPSRTFQTKPALGLELIRCAQARGLPFEVVGCDTVYGQDPQFRADLDREGVVYVADVPATTQVYLDRPVVGIPETPLGKRGRPYSRPRVLSEDEPVKVRQVATDPRLEWQSVTTRFTERGPLTYRCVARRVWTVTEARQVREEWLFIRREPDGSFSVSLSNAATETPLEQLARWRCLRYFGERTFQDAKSECGWDELEARKYRAWQHHTALTALALWFIGETKLDWVQAHPRDPELKRQLEVEVLPALSVANVREMLKAALPLEQMTGEQARQLVIQHLVNRSRSTRSRLKGKETGERQHRNRDRGPT